MKLTTGSLILLMSASQVMAGAPKIVADIAPIHSLVARVMGDLGSPDLLIPANASPHEYHLRPSEAQSLQDADLIFWMGEDLTPWLERTMANLPQNARITELLALEEVDLLPIRETVIFGDHEDDHDHGHGHKDHDDHEKKDAHHKEDGHDDHHQHEKEKEDDHDHGDGHNGDGHDDHGHHHGAHDPHAWLSPSNGKIVLQVIAEQLATADPEHRDIYLANALAGQQEIDDTCNEIAGMLKLAMETKYVVFHDAYQYFEQSFGIEVAGALSLGDATATSPARVEEIQEVIKAEGITCVLAEPQYNPNLIKAISGDLKIGVLDPLGAELETGPDLYQNLLRNMAETFANCE